MWNSIQHHFSDILLSLGRERRCGISPSVVLVVGLLIALLGSPSVVAADKTFHAIQVGSYPFLAEAEAAFALLEKNLPSEARPFLRIEKIPPHFTIRIGKAANKEEIVALLPDVRKISEAAEVRKVYFQEDRIVKRGGGDATAPDKASEERKGKNKDTEQMKKAGPQSEGQWIPPSATTTVSAPSVRPKFVGEQEPFAETPRMRIKDSVVMKEPSPTCVAASCHQNLKQLARPHAPVESDSCLACHVEKSPSHPNPGQVDFALAENGAALCFRCHEPMARAEIVHEPMREGSCVACHLPHGGDGPALLPHRDDQRDICFKCHDAADFQGEKVHGPASLGACTLCHDPHQSRRKKLLKEKVQDSCVSCHDEFVEGMKSSQFIHPAITEKSCTACHSPHSSNKPHLLRSAVIDLCFECHQKQAAQYNNAKVKHQVLYNEHGCGNCHQTHYGDKDALLLKQEKDLCFDCHGQEEQADKPKKVRNIKKEIEGKKYLHGPVAKGICNGCHDMHGTDNEKLLKGPVPVSLYAPYTENAYDFCFTCHDRKMLSAPETRGETEFRNGARNLHYLHVVRSQKGRTCRSCHESHASNAPKLMSAEGVPFGQWRVPVRFEKSDNGGSCLPGCHRRLEYDRYEPVNYAVPRIMGPGAAQEGKN